MKGEIQTIALIFLSIFFMASCSSVAKNQDKVVSMAKPKKIKNIASKSKLVPMKFDATSIIVTRHDRGPAFKDRIEFAAKLPSISNQVKQIILQHEKSKPTQYTLSGKQLKNCQLIGKRAEVDAIPSTYEWVVTTADSCYNPSPTKLKTIWLVQLKNNQGKVLLATRGSRILILKDDNKSDINIRVTSYTKTPNDYTGEYHPTDTPLVCYSKWKYSKGKIIWKNEDEGELYVKDSLLPENMENLAIPAKKFSASIRESMESGKFSCPKK